MSPAAFVVSPLPPSLSSPSSSPPLPSFSSNPTHRAPRVRLRRVAAHATRSAAPRVIRHPRAHAARPTPRVRVTIDAPEPNRRLITASNLIDAPIATVWHLLSDYSRLADYIPNLVLSRRRPHPAGRIRVEQCGAQRILGFQFRASLVMDMEEVNAASPLWRAINFDLVSSRDFRQFEGVWRMDAVDARTTALYYTVSIVPKGLVPVRAIEWRISEDVPQNMLAVRLECERRRRVAVAANRRRHPTPTTNSHPS
ncbi:unnamed protein product [Agarophyton chilense]